MDTRQALIKMLRHLLEDSVVLHQQGAGYYSCVPIIQRYNKLLESARPLFDVNGAPHGLIDTFEPQKELDPKDPADKMKVLQGLRVEAGQLISLLESLGEALEEENP